MKARRGTAVRAPTSTHQVVLATPLVQVEDGKYLKAMNDEPKDVRLPVMVTRSEAAAIDDWRFENRIPTRAEAIRTLIQRGLNGQAVPRCSVDTTVGAVASRNVGPNAR